MLKNILIGLDGSEYCNEAIRCAIDLSKNFGAKLFGLGIIDAPAIFDHSPGVAGAIHYKESANKRQYEGARDRVRACLRSFQARCDEANVNCEISHNEGSPVAEFLKEAAGYDIIIMGQETYFQHDSREGPCSTLVHLLKDTPRPVVVIPNKIEFKYNLEDPAVIAFDGSIPSARAMQLFTLLSYDDPSNEIHLVTVCDEEEEGRTRQEKALLYLERWYGRKPTSAILHGRRPDALLNYTRKVNARVLAMGAYGRSGLKSFFFGSTTRTILKKANTMLFLYH
jgi:nucleotide-binding universal stress UspA family protein